MPIDFPPPPQPLQGDVATLQAEAGQGEVTVPVAGYTLHVHAPGVLGEEQIRAATEGLDDLSNAVRALAAAAQRAGTIAPKTLYVRSGNEVYVSLYAGTIGTVNAPAQLMPYFEGLGGGKEVELGDFERRRLFASVHASRMGAGYTPIFSEGEGNTYDLTLKPGTDVVDPGSVRVNLSNAGNRFTGREFLDLDARRGTDSGDEYSVLARTAASVLRLDDDEPGSDYHEYALGWSRVAPWGLVGANLRYLDYRLLSGGTRFNGELLIGDIGYTGVLSSTLVSRLTVQGKVDYIQRKLEQDADGLLRQEEPYPSLELGAAYSRTLRVFSQGWLALASFSARKGFGDGDPRLTLADLDYWLVRPSVSLRWQQLPWSAELQAAGQYSSVTVPEQQQWVLGGIGNLHAYVPGVVVGDRGALVRAVGERGLFDTQNWSLKLRGFVEYGASQYSEDVPGRPSGDLQSLADAGAELVAGYKPFLELALTAAAPIYDDGVNKAARDDARSDFFFRITAKF